ncbi:Protein split end [Taenia crassiceps]|uniref:Protein split end n=1 Tax=Taenia crassiceps TaxID=6207 RepID=A0ABR4QR29_9CEST
MNETKYLWITNIPSKCREEDVTRVLRRHGDIKGAKRVPHNSCFNLIVEYLDRSSATRAVRSQNLLKGNILKVEYCDSSGNPWISSSSHRISPIGLSQSQRSDRKSDAMLVDRAGPSSAAPSHHHHHHHHHPHQAQQPQQQQQRQLPSQQLRVQSTTSPSSNRQSGLQDTVGSASLKVVFTPPPKYAETQIKQALCDELHKFVKTYHVNLLPAAATGGRQTRVALVMFRRTEDEERAFLAFRNAGRCLFGAPVHVELCSDSEVIGSSSRTRPSPTSSAIPIHSSNSSPPSLAVPRTTRSPVSSLPTRSLIVHGLTAGPNGPVSEVQLNTAFQRFGAILHVQMRPTSNSAIIEFVELRGSTRAMTTHQRDPLRLGGRPLRLLYTPSRPVSCLFINDIPTSLIHHSEGELKTLFSRVVPVAQVSKITRSQESSANTTVHTCALLELASQELAAQLLEYLRSPESPLVLATQNRSPESFTTPRLPTFVCSVDFASPKQMGKVMTFAKVVETVRIRPVGMTTRPPQPPPSFDTANAKSRSSAPRPPAGSHRPRDQLRHDSSEEGYSRSSSTSSSSLSKRLTDSNTAPPPPSTSVATFPSQRWGVTEAPLFIPQKRFSDPLRGEPSRGHGTATTNTASLNLSEGAHVCESMYDKIKRRTEGEKERRKRPTLQSEEIEASRLVRRKRRRKQHYQSTLVCGIGDNTEDEGDYEGSGEDLVEEIGSLGERHNLKCSDMSSQRRSRSRPSKNLSTSFSRSVESHRQKSRTTQLSSKHVSTTITRLSLGMSVPMAASYHTISKTPSSYGDRRLSRLSSPSGESRSESATSGNMDIKPTSIRRSSDKGIKSSSLLESGSTTGPSVSRSHSLNDVDSASGCSMRPTPAQKRIKRQRDCVKPSISSKATFKKTEWRKLSIQATVFRPSRVASSSLSTEDEEEKDHIYNSRFSKFSRNTKVRLLNHNTSSKTQKLRTTSKAKAKAKARKTHSSSRISDGVSSGSVSSFGSSRRRRCSVDMEGVSASTPLSCGGRLAKPTPPSRPSDFHHGLSEADDGYSLDDFDRFSANTAMTPSTEAMEISAETGDEEPDHPVSEWFTRMSSNHSESEVEPEQEQAGAEEEEENGDSRCGDQKSLLINFDDINILNASKEDSLNLSNRDAIGDIGMDDQPSPRLNASSDKSASRSLVEEPAEAVKPTPPDEILSPYSSSSPTQSLCSACSRSSPSPIITAPVQTSRAGAAANVVTETTTCVRTTVSVPQENISVKPPEKPTPLSENRDLKRYVQSVIERVKAETVDDAVTHRSVTSITPITSPLHHPPTASPPPPPLPPTPSSLPQTSRKGASPATSRRTSGATPPGLVSSASSPNVRSATAKMLFESSVVGLLSIPGVNACAPLSDAPSVSPVKPISEVVVEPKTLRSTTRRRAKMAAATTTSGTPAPTATTASTVAVDVATAVPKQPTDPYEPNFDDDSPPLVKMTVNATSPLVVNTSLASEHPGTASAVSSVTTTEEAASTNDTFKGNTIRRSGLDSVDETIADVCCGRFDMKSYLDSWGLQPPTSGSRSGPSTVTTATSMPMSTTAITTTSVKAMDTKPPVASAPTNNPIFTAIINALQSITGSPVLIGGSTNNSGSGVRQTNPETGQQLPQKTSTVVVGSSPPTISATTITFPVFFKNVFPAANNSTNNAPSVAATAPCPIKTTAANSHPVTMTTASSNMPQQQLLHQQGSSATAVTRPQSSTTDSVIESPHPYRVRRSSDNNEPASGRIDDAISASGSTGQPQQRPIFNPRNFTSPPPRYPPFPSPRHASTAPQPPPPSLSHTPTPWSMSPMSAYPRPTRQESSPVAATPTTNAFSLMAMLEKLSCSIDPDLVLPILQAAIQDGQHLDPDLLAPLTKVFQQYCASGGDGGSIAPPSNTANSTPSPSQASAGGGSGGGNGQYHHLPRAGGASTPPIARTGSFDQAYPLVWQGRLSLKNSEVSVALHYVQGNADLLRACISTLAAGGGGSPQQALVTSGGPLRIVQRMRLEASQLDAVQRKITQEGASCACVAFASGANRADLAQQNVVLSDGFIRYMLEKGAAGIINVGQPGAVQGLYVVHIFPPCEFSHTLLRLAAPDLHQSILQAQLPHLLIVITTV